MGLDKDGKPTDLETLLILTTSCFGILDKSKQARSSAIYIQ